MDRINLVAGLSDGTIILYDRKEMKKISQINLSPSILNQNSSFLKDSSEIKVSLQNKISFLNLNEGMVISAMVESKDEMKHVGLSIWSPNSNYFIQPLKYKLIEDKVIHMEFNVSKNTIYYLIDTDLDNCNACITLESWKPSFKKLNSNPQKYREINQVLQYEFSQVLLTSLISNSQFLDIFLQLKSKHLDDLKEVSQALLEINEKIAEKNNQIISEFFIKSCIKNLLNKTNHQSLKNLIIRKLIIDNSSLYLNSLESCLQRLILRSSKYHFKLPNKVETNIEPGMQNLIAQTVQEFIDEMVSNLNLLSKTTLFILQNIYRVSNESGEEIDMKKKSPNKVCSKIFLDSIHSYLYDLHGHSLNSLDNLNLVFKIISIPLYGDEKKSSFYSALDEFFQQNKDKFKNLSKILADQHINNWNEINDYVSSDSSQTSDKNNFIIFEFLVKNIDEIKTKLDSKDPLFKSIELLVTFHYNPLMHLKNKFIEKDSKYNKMRSNSSPQTKKNFFKKISGKNVKTKSQEKLLKESN